MRKPFAVLVAGLVAVLAVVMGSSLTVLASEEVEARATVVPVPPEFMPSAPLDNVRGRISIEQTVIHGQPALVVEGRARNMDPGETYVSLIYTSPGTGPTACQATPQLTFTQMFLGTWKVDRHGRGTLHAVKTPAGNTSPTPSALQAFVGALGVVPPDLSGPGSFVALTPTVRSVSIREMRLESSPVGLPPLPPGVMVPERIACGPLHIDRED